MSWDAEKAELISERTFRNISSCPKIGRDYITGNPSKKFYEE
ncbi:MAG: hypothetical protein ACTSVV_04715 [Promethearchaeota archaeon]